MRRSTLAAALSLPITLAAALAACGTNHDTIGHGTSTASNTGASGGWSPGPGVDCDDGPNYTECPCSPGDTRVCYTGPLETRGAGACHDGVQTCAELQELRYGFGPCTGEVLPSADNGGCTGPSPSDGGAPDAPDSGPPPEVGCFGSCAPGAAASVGAPVSTWISWYKTMSACADGDEVVVLVKDGSGAKLRRVNAAADLVSEVSVPISLLADWMHDIGGLVCLGGGRYATAFLASDGELKLARFDASGALLGGLLTLDAPSAKPVAPDLARVGDELYATWVRGPTGELFSQRFDPSLTPLGAPVPLAVGRKVNGNMIEIAPRTNSLAIAFLDNADTTFKLTSVSGDTAGPVVASGFPSQPTLGHAFATIGDASALCYAYAGDPVSNIPAELHCRMYDAALQPTSTDALVEKHLYDHPVMASDGCHFYVVKPCSTDVPGYDCPNVGTLFTGDPATGAWTAAPLPDAYSFWTASMSAMTLVPAAWGPTLFVLRGGQQSQGHAQLQQVPLGCAKK
jgi:hypothetical protein